MVSFSIISYAVLGICIILFIAVECIRVSERRLARIKEAKSKMDVIDKVFYIIYEVSQYGFCTWEFCSEPDYKRIDWDTRLDSLGVDREELFQIMDKIENTFGIKTVEEEAQCWITAGEIVNYVKNRLKNLPT